MKYLIEGSKESCDLGHQTLHRKERKEGNAGDDGEKGQVKSCGCVLTAQVVVRVTLCSGVG